MASYFTHYEGRDLVFVQAKDKGVVGYAKLRNGKWRAMLFKKPARSIPTAKKQIDADDGTQVGHTYDQASAAIFVLKNQHEQTLERTS